MPTISRNRRVRSRLRQRRPRTPYQGTSLTPYSSQADTQVGILNRNLQQTQADITGRRLALEQQSGFGADQSDPFSVAKTLEQNYRARQAGTLNSGARTGQLYAGSMNRARSLDRTGYERDLNTSMRDYQAQQGELAREGLRAQTTYDEGVLSAGAGQLEQALQQPLDPSTAGRGALRRRMRNRRRRR